MNIDTKRDKIKDYYNLEELKLLAKKISISCTEGDVITLSGPLGVGKTTFAKYLISNLRVMSILKSPHQHIISSNHIEDLMKSRFYIWISID